MTVNGFEVETLQLGQGEDLIMLHGWGYDYSLLLPLAQRLSDSYRVTLINMPGHGNSPEPAEPIGVYDYAEIVPGVMKACGIESAYFLGHSFGCRLALIVGSRYPSLIKKAVLCGAAGLREKHSVLWHVKVGFYKLGKFFVKTFAPKKYEAWRAGKGSEDWKKLSPVMKATFSKVVNEDLTPCLEKIKCPVFLIWGENDTATPLWMAEKMEQTIPDCAKAVYKGRTHYAFLEEASRSEAIIRTFFR